MLFFHDASTSEENIRPDLCDLSVAPKPSLSLSYFRHEINISRSRILLASLVKPRSWQCSRGCRVDKNTMSRLETNEIRGDEPNEDEGRNEERIYGGGGGTRKGRFRLIYTHTRSPRRLMLVDDGLNVCISQRKNVSRTLRGKFR